MARTGRTPFTAAEPITTPSLLISMSHDTLAPKRASMISPLDSATRGALSENIFKTKTYPRE